jgi:hypothetical protein
MANVKIQLGIPEGRSVNLHTERIKAVRLRA